MLFWFVTPCSLNLKSPGADRGFAFAWKTLLFEVVCGADGENTRRKTGVLEAEPVLVLPVGAGVEVMLHLIVDTDAAGCEVIGQVGLKSICEGRVVEDAASVHQLGVGDEFAVGAEIAATNFVGLFVEIGRVLDEMKLALHADVREKVEVDVSSATVITVGVVRVCGRKAATDFKIQRLRRRGSGLGMEHGCGSQQAYEGDCPY